MDELRISRYYVENPGLSRYAGRTGVGLSRVFDLEYAGSRLEQIQATYATPANSEIYFSYHLADELLRLSAKDAGWVPFLPGVRQSFGGQGRYLQLKVELMPDGTGSQTPSISDITIIYEPDLPPTAPAFLAARAGNGTVALTWQKVNENDVRGYKVYYGREPGNYWGTGSVEGDSPVDVGMQTNLTLTGLENGRLYYFAAVSYDSAQPPHHSPFSKEASARPSRVLP